MSPSSAPNSPPLNEAEDEIDLLGLFGALIDNKWLIASITAAFTAIGVIYALMATPIYRSDATVQVEQKKASIPGLSDMSDMFGAPPEAVTEIQLITSRNIIGKAVDNLRLDIVVEPNRFPLLGDFIARRFRPQAPGDVAGAWLGMSRFGWGGEALEVFQLDVPESLQNEPLTLVAGQGGQYRLLDADDNLLVEGSVGQLAARNGVKIQVSRLVANEGMHFMVTRERRLTTILRYQKDLSVSESARQSGVIRLSLENDQPGEALKVLDEISKAYVRQNVDRASAEASSSLEFLRGQLPGVRKDLEESENELSAYQMHSKSADLALETKALLDQSVAIDTKLSELKLQQAEMETRFTRQHPAFKALEKQMSDLRAKQGGLSGRIQNLPETQQDLLRLSRDVQVSTAIYTQLLNKTQELDVMRAGAVGNVRIIDAADVDTTLPVRPQKKIIVLAALLLGLLASVVVVVIRKALNRGVETPDAIEQLGLPVYASIPYSPLQAQAEKKGKDSRADKAAPLLAVRHPTDLSIESLRSLRTSLHFATLEAGNNLLMISGPSPEVGKTFICANLAAVIAQAGQRVLLVDVDMRKGYLHKVIGGAESNGLSDLLVKRCEFADVVRKTPVEGLCFVPRGQIPPNPSELLMHPNFTAFLEQAGRDFDLVILDTPPLLAVTDAAIVGRQAGTSLIVTRFGRNSAREIDLTVRRFAQNGIEIKGAILNGVQKRASAYGYGQYGYYHYEYKQEKSS